MLPAFIGEVRVHQGARYTGPEPLVPVCVDGSVPGSRVGHVPASAVDLGPGDERRDPRPVHHDVTGVEEVAVMKEDIMGAAWNLE